MISSSALSVTGPACAWMRKASSMSLTLVLMARWSSSASLLIRLRRWLRCDAVSNEESAPVHQEDEHSVPISKRSIAEPHGIGWPQGVHVIAQSLVSASLGRPVVGLAEERQNLFFRGLPRDNLDILVFGGRATTTRASVAIPVGVAGAHEATGRRWLLCKVPHFISSLSPLGGERRDKEHRTGASQERTPLHH